MLPRIAFGQWLPDPTVTPLRDGYGVQYVDGAAIRARRGALSPNASERLLTEFRRAVPTEVVDPATVDAAIGFDFFGSLAIGSFDPAVVARRLTTSDREGSTGSGTAATRTATTPTRTPWGTPERYRGFELYGTESVYAISSEVVLAVAPPWDADAVAVAKAIIDAHAGEAGRYAESNAYVASLLGVVDAPHALWCYPEAMDGSTARGFRTDTITGGLKAWRYGPDRTVLTYGNTYVDAQTAASGELAAFLEANAERFAPYEGLDVTVEGQLAWTDGTIPTGQFDFLSPGGPADGVHTPN